MFQKMKNSQSTKGIRQYKKSELPRFQWTSELHQHFVEIVEGLGGKYKATPKRILQMMDVRALKLSHVKSHLQMYRNMKNRNTKDIILPIGQFSDKRQDFANLPLLDICSLEKSLGCGQVNNDRGLHIFEKNPHQVQFQRNCKHMTDLCQDYPQETQGITLSVISKEEDIDLNGFYDDSELGPHSSTNQINLDLTLSTYFSNSIELRND